MGFGAWICDKERYHIINGFPIKSLLDNQNRHDYD
jgi:hypothetical protein